MRSGPSHLRAVCVLAAVAVAALAVSASASALGMFYVHVCGGSTPGTNLSGGRVGIARSGASGPGVGASYQCPPAGGADGLEVYTASTNVAAGTRAYWEIDAPSGLTVLSARTVTYGPEGMVSYGVDNGQGWGGGFYWKGGGAQVQPGEQNYTSPPINSPYFGWQVVCGARTCDGVHKPAELGVLELQIAAGEESGPSVMAAPNTLGTSTGWVRGKWPITFSADGPSGACQASAALDGTSVSQPVNEPTDPVSWHQCPTAVFSQLFDTASVRDGPDVPLTMWARDAAFDYLAGHYLSSTVTKSVNIDNAPVSLSLSGPTDAPSTAGAQTITATAQAGLSGVRGTWCSVDGSPYQLYPGPTGQITITGIGEHTANCFAENNALDVNGQPARSTPQTWRLTIREPSVSTVSFVRVVNALRCGKQRERVRIPAHWVTVTLGGQPQKVRVPAETRTITVVHCHPRIVTKRVRVDGHWRIKRIVLLPHIVRVSTKAAAYGAGSTISGWLGNDRGNAIGGQPVAIQTAPDNGSGAFTTVATTTSAPDGSWSATIPAGPSRIVRALYGGSSTLEPSVSSAASVVVPASLSFAIAPHQTHWGATIKLTGHLNGGYIPPSGELVVLWVGWPGGSTEIGHLYTGADGRFSSTYTFLRGNGTEQYRLWAATARESDYPFAPARSRPILVTVTR